VAESLVVTVRRENFTVSCCRDTRSGRAKSTRRSNHIDAKRQALDALDTARRGEAGNGNAGNDNGEAANATEIETVVQVSDDLTSQSRHSCFCRARRPPVTVDST
jgi:hypothetical protein